MNPKPITPGFSAARSRTRNSLLIVCEPLRLRPFAVEKKVRTTNDEVRSLGNMETSNLEPRTLNLKPETLNLEPRTMNPNFPAARSRTRNCPLIVCEPLRLRPFAVEKQVRSTNDEVRSMGRGKP